MDHAEYVFGRSTNDSALETLRHAWDCKAVPSSTGGEERWVSGTVQAGVRLGSTGCGHPWQAEQHAAVINKWEEAVGYSRGKYQSGWTRRQTRRHTDARPSMFSRGQQQVAPRDGRVLGAGVGPRTR